MKTTLHRRFFAASATLLVGATLFPQTLSAADPSDPSTPPPYAFTGSDYFFVGGGGTGGAGANTGGAGGIGGGGGAGINDMGGGGGGAMYGGGGGGGKYTGRPDQEGGGTDINGDPLPPDPTPDPNADTGIGGTGAYSSTGGIGAQDGYGIGGIGGSRGDSKGTVGGGAGDGNSGFADTNGQIVYRGNGGFSSGGGSAQPGTTPLGSNVTLSTSDNHRWVAVGGGGGGSGAGDNSGDGGAGTIGTLTLTGAGTQLDVAGALIGGGGGGGGDHTGGAGADGTLILKAGTSLVTHHENNDFVSGRLAIGGGGGGGGGTGGTGGKGGNGLLDMSAGGSLTTDILQIGGMGGGAGDNGGKGGKGGDGVATLGAGASVSLGVGLVLGGYDGVASFNAANTALPGAAGAGTLNLGGGSVVTFTGTTATIQITQTGTLNIGGATAKGAATGGTFVVDQTTRTDSQGTTSPPPQLSLVNDGVINFNQSDASYTGFNGIAITGTGKVTVNSLGKTILGSANTYSGGTTITAGTLVANQNAALGTGNVSVGSGGTLEVGAQGVVLGHGANLAIDGMITFDAMSTVTLKGGNYSFHGMLNLNGMFDNAAAGQYTLITGFNGMDESMSMIGFNNSKMTATYNDGILTITPVPEPATYGLIGAGTLALASFVRRRKKFRAL